VKAHPRSSAVTPKRCGESITHDERLSDTASAASIEYGKCAMKSHEGRWISPEIRRAPPGGLPRRHSAQETFQCTPAIGEAVRIDALSSRSSAPWTRNFPTATIHERRRVRVYSVHHGRRAVDARYASVMLFEPVAPNFRSGRHAAVPRCHCNRQHFSPSDKRAITMSAAKSSSPSTKESLWYRSFALFRWRTYAGHRRRGRDEYHARLSSKNASAKWPAPRARCEKITHSLAVLLEALVMTLAAGVIACCFGSHYFSDRHAASSGLLTKTTQAKWTSTSRSRRHHDALHGYLVVVGVISGWLPAMQPQNSTPSKPSATSNRHERNDAETRVRCKK